MEVRGGLPRHAADQALEPLRLERAELALEGLSLGDAFGERFFDAPGLAVARIEERLVPRGRWDYTDDTEMALSIFEELREAGCIDPDSLARRFADRYVRRPDRGYGGGAHRILGEIARGASWRTAAGEAFGGQGSMGNGAAMRVAPIGAYFADDLPAAIANATASAIVTHAHPEGQSGAIAVAVAAARACTAPAIRGRAFLESVIERVPAGATRDGLVAALAFTEACAIDEAALALGNGSRVISSDTVPFALWCAAHHLDDFAEAMWTTVRGLGDRDTTCAIAGGVVALAAPGTIPAAWVAAREALDRAS